MKWIVLYLLLAFFPVIYLIFTGKKDAETSVLFLSLFQTRRLGLMENSVRIALSSALVCMTVGCFAAMRLYAAMPKRPLIRWFFLLSAPIPSYIYALTYMNLIRFLGKWIPSLLRFRMAGMVPCIAVESLAYLPFACAAALIGLEQVDAGEWKAALLMQNADKCFWKIVFPKQLPYLLAMGAVIFVLSITDYSIPSLFQVNVYAMEIFSDYSAQGRSVHSLKLALPILLLSTAVILPALLSMQNGSRPMPAKVRVSACYSGKMKFAGNCAVTFAVIQILLPILALVPEAGNLAKGSVQAWKELSNSFAVGILAVALLTVPAAGMALLLSDNMGPLSGVKRKKSGGILYLLLKFMAIFPLAVPGVLTGIGVLKFFSDTPLSVFRSGNLLPAAGMAVRYLPFSMLVQYGCYMRMDREKIDAARLLQAKSGAAFSRVQLRLMRPGLIISGIVVFLLTLGDVGTALMLMPAGKEPLSVKIYNYLHYGASETVAVFCLLQVIVCALIMGILYFALDHRLYCIPGAYGRRNAGNQAYYKEL